MELTREQRHEIYKEGLKMYDDPDYICGLCLTITTASRRVLNNYKVDAFSQGFKKFPEIEKHKPKRFNKYWFNSFDTTPRISILKQAISETAPL